jgi:hypothetical protein
MTTEKTGALPFSPEVEKRRADYQALAEAIIKMDALQSQRQPETLDVEAPGWMKEEPDNHILWESIQDHLKALFENLLTVRGDDFWRTIYIELRLYYDEQMLATKSGPFSYLRPRISVEKR